jgi:hypothetical protein
MANPWTPEHDEVLHGIYTGDLSLSRMTAAFNARCGTSFSRSAIAGRARRLKLTRTVVSVDRVWTPEQDSVLRDLHSAGVPMAKIAKQLNQQFGTLYSKGAITGRCLRIGLRRRSDVPKPAPPKKVSKQATNVELTKSQMYAMLADAVRVTARM